MGGQSLYVIEFLEGVVWIGDGVLCRAREESLEWSICEQGAHIINRDGKREWCSQDGGWKESPTSCATFKMVQNMMCPS